MCGLCGVLGGGTHWTEDRTGDEASGLLQTRRAARLARVRLMNAVLAHYRLRLADWQGSSYVLTGPTGQSELADDLVQVWRAAERMTGRPCDPLDPPLIDSLERDG
jgi:hypothetical protein